MKDQLKQKIIQAYYDNQNKGLKHLEAAIQDAIEDFYPDKLWWEVCSVSIFELLFFSDLGAVEIIDEIVRNCKGE